VLETFGILYFLLAGGAAVPMLLVVPWAMTFSRPE